jgi:predicted nucleic acid-binding protein
LIVLDASLVIAWLVADELPWIESGVYESLPDNTCLVPSHWPLEVSNALRSSIRAGRLGLEDAHAIMDRLDLLMIDVQAPLGLDEIFPLAQFALTHQITAYDAAYLQLAFQRRVPLATLDLAMRAAASRLNLPLLPV